MENLIVEVTTSLDRSQAINDKIKPKTKGLIIFIYKDFVYLFKFILIAKSI